MSYPWISLTCDFGDTFAVAQMEMVVHSICPDIRFFILSNQVSEYSLIEGAFILLKGYEFAPMGSVHIGVVDPGVGSERIGVAIETSKGWFVGPNNGLLYPAAFQAGIVNAYEIVTKNISSHVTSTFHGRDVFARIAAMITSEQNMSGYLKKTDVELVKLVFANFQVTHIDPYGNLKVYVNPDRFIDCKKVRYQTGTIDLHIPFVRTFSDVQVGGELAYLGSHGTLELAVNQGSFAKKYEVKLGDRLNIDFCK
jgi:S-adenosyl-L-methionine hydrolase (adenosine-forming)